jgi:organic radical activating enzyme
MFGKNKIYSQKDFKYHNVLFVKDIFHTIQGEGVFSGWPSTFIRLAHCTLKCNFCDTDFETDVRHLSINETLEKIEKITPDHTRLIVITGGEPFLQPLCSRLCRELLNLHYTVQIETSGSVWLDDLPVTNTNFHIVCSPKTGKLHPKLEQWIKAYKYIISSDNHSENDGLPIINPQTNKFIKLARPISKGIPIYISPMDEYDKDKNKENLNTIKNISLKYGYRISLQVHKYLGVE